MAKIGSDAEFSLEEKNFAEEFKRERESRSWSQEELARQMRLCNLPYVTQATVSRIENLVRPVRLMEAQAVRLIFKRSVYSMTNPDPRDVLLNMIKVDDWRDREHYVTFKDSLKKTILAQIRAADDVQKISHLYEDSDLDPDTASKVRTVKMNRQNFAEMRILSEAADIVSATRRGSAATSRSELLEDKEIIGDAPEIPSWRPVEDADG